MVGRACCVHHLHAMDTLQTRSAWPGYLWHQEASAGDLTEQIWQLPCCMRGGVSCWSCVAGPDVRQAWTCPCSRGIARLRAADLGGHLVRERAGPGDCVEDADAAHGGLPATGRQVHGHPVSAGEAGHGGPVPQGVRPLPESVCVLLLLLLLYCWCSANLIKPGSRAGAWHSHLEPIRRLADCCPTLDAGQAERCFSEGCPCSTHALSHLLLWLQLPPASAPRPVLGSVRKQDG